MELTSGISKRFKQAFLLDEENLRRFQGILGRAAKTLPFPTQTVFHVEREDDRYYETINIDEVLADPNITARRITLVAIELRKDAEQISNQGQNPSGWRVAVVYSLREKDVSFPDPDMVRIRVATNDKNWALLLADELEPQMQRTFKVKRTPRWLLALLLILLLVVISKTMAIKYRDFIIPVFLIGFPCAGLVFLLADYSFLRNWFIKTFGPESVFLWGDEAQAYPQREQTRLHLQWGVVVAFFASLAASIVFFFMTK